MDNNATSLAELDEDILTFDVQDDALERAAIVAAGQAVTIGYNVPFQESNSFELAVNLKTAKALGLTVPPAFFLLPIT